MEAIRHLPCSGRYSFHAEALCYCVLPLLPLLPLLPRVPQGSTFGSSSALEPLAWRPAPSRFARCGCVQPQGRCHLLPGPTALRYPVRCCCVVMLHGPLLQGLADVTE